VRRESANYVAYTNVPDERSTLYYLAREGYGTIEYLEQMDTPEYLDLIEHEQIRQDIELYHMQQARDGN